jgi:hypothetical protein
MKSLTCAAVLGLAVFSNYAFAQAPMGHGSANMSDDDLIKLAISAAPEAVTKDATVVMVASDGNTRTLRQGSGQWTCMPGHADPANPDPMCGDKNAMEWAAAWMAHKDPRRTRSGSCICFVGTAERATQTRIQPRKNPATIGSRRARTS